MKCLFFRAFSQCSDWSRTLSVALNMLHAEVIFYCVLATAVRGNLDLKEESIAKCSALKNSFLQLIASLEPNASPVAFAVPPIRHSICSEMILSSAAEKSSSPLLIFSDANQRYHPLSAKLAMTVLVGNPDQIKKILNNLRSGYIWDSGSVVVTIIENDSPVDILRSVGLLQQAFVRKFRILSPVSDDEVAVWSAADPTASICGRSGRSATLLGIWKSTEVGRDYSFLTELPTEPALEIVRCTLRIVITVDEPFTFDENPPRGYEIELLKYLAEQTVSTLEFILPQANVSLPAHPDDLIMFDSLRLLNANPVDSVAGCLAPSKLRSRLLTFVNTFHHDFARIWVREVPSMTQPIPQKIAYALPVIFLLWIAVIWLLKHFRSGMNRRTSYLTAWAFMMEGPSPQELLPHSFRSRAFLCLFLVCTFVTNMDIRSRLMSVLTSSRTRPEFLSYDDLVASDAVIGFTAQVLSHMFEDGVGDGVEGTQHDQAVFFYRRSMDCMRPHWPLCLRKYTAADAADGGFALFATSARMRSVALTLARSKAYISLSEPAFQAMCAMYLRKGNPWDERFKRLILIAASADLPTFWSKRGYRRKDLVTSERTRNPTLDLDDFILAFQILSVGLASASGLLFLELLFDKYRYRVASLLQPFIRLF